MARDEERPTMENCTTKEWKELMSPGEAVGELSDRLEALEAALGLEENPTVDNLFMIAALSLETLSHELWQLQKKDESLTGSPESKHRGNVAGPLFTHRDKGAE
jgi:hypothetical protein